MAYRVRTEAIADQLADHSAQVRSVVDRLLAAASRDPWTWGYAVGPDPRSNARRQSFIVGGERFELIIAIAERLGVVQAQRLRQRTTHRPRR